MVVGVVGDEGWVHRHHDEEQNATREHITLRDVIQGPIEVDFGGRIPPTPTHWYRCAFATELPGEPKITDLNHMLTRDHEVVGLYVPMINPIEVHIIDSIDYL